MPRSPINLGLGFNGDGNMPQPSPTATLPRWCRLCRRKARWEFGRASQDPFGLGPPAVGESRHNRRI